MAIKADVILSGGTILEGQSRNISFGGTFIELPEIPKIHKGDCFCLRLLKRVEFTGEVIHSNPVGIGFQFNSILIKYYEQFRKLMLHNAPDPDRLIKELGRNCYLNGD